jgi:hypothetical protein
MGLPFLWLRPLRISDLSERPMMDLSRRALRPSRRVMELAAEASV